MSDENRGSGKNPGYDGGTPLPPSPPELPWPTTIPGEPLDIDRSRPINPAVDRPAPYRDEGEPGAH